MWWCLYSSSDRISIVLWYNCVFINHILLDFGVCGLDIVEANMLWGDLSWHHYFVWNLVCGNNLWCKCCGMWWLRSWHPRVLKATKIKHKGQKWNNKSTVWVKLLQMMWNIRFKNTMIMIQNKWDATIWTKITAWIEYIIQSQPRNGQILHTWAKNTTQIEYIIQINFNYKREWNINMN